MKKNDRIPFSGYLFEALIFIFIGMDGIISKELSLQKWEYIYFYEIGTSAVYAGLIFIILGLILGYFYFRCILPEIYSLLKSKDKLNIVYLLWLLFFLYQYFYMKKILIEF